MRLGAVPDSGSGGSGGDADRASSPAGRAVLASSGVVVCCLLGAALAAAADFAARADNRAPPGPARYWVTDRDAQSVIALDRNLFVVSTVFLEHPLELRARSDGGLWVACATSAGPTAPHVLRRLDAAGVTASESAIGPLFDLDCLDGDRALLVEARPGGGREVALITDGLRRSVAAAPMPSCVTGRDAEILAGSEHGVLTLHSAHDPGGVLATRSVGGVLADLAPGPQPRTWWVLDASGGSGGGRILLVDFALATIWERQAGLSALHLAPVPNTERVWIADVNVPVARRLGPQGAIEIAAAPLSMPGADRGLARSDGGVLFVTPGAILHLDAQGASAPGQGGFDFLIEIATR